MVELRRLAASVSSRLFLALAIARRSTNGEPVSAATRSIATITPSSSERAREDRDVADVVIEHGQHHVRARLVRRDADHGGGHGRAHRVVGREPARDDLGAEVAVGDDPVVAASEVHHDRAHRPGVHQLRRLAQGRLGIDHDGRPAAPAPPAVCCATSGLGGAIASPSPRPPRARSERVRKRRLEGGPAGGPRPRRPASRPACPRGPGPRTWWEGPRAPRDGRTSRPRRAGRRACRRSSSSTASAPDDPDAALRELALGDDRGAGGEELDLGPGGERLQGLLVEPAERVPAPQELGDVVHRCVSRREPPRLPRPSA